MDDGAKRALVERGASLLPIGIVGGGVKAGIERTALVLMPALFLIVGGLAIYASSLTWATFFR